MRTLYTIVVGLMGLMCSFFLHARPPADSLCIYFQRGYAVVDLSLRENQKTTETLITTLKQFEADSFPYRLRLRLEGKASPDGLTSANVRLTKKRVVALLAYLREQIQIPDSILVVEANGIDWEGLTISVKQDSLCPSREEVLHILTHTPEWIYDDCNRIIDGRKKQLMDLKGGVPYRYLSEKVFPDLRNVSVSMGMEGLYPGDVRESAVSSENAEGSEAAEIDKLKIPGNTDHVRSPEKGGDSDLSASDLLESSERLKTPGDQKQTKDLDAEHLQVTASDADLKPASDIPATSADVSIDMTKKAPISHSQSGIDSTNLSPLHRIALKTNFLYDAILMPSLEIEYRIDDRWSVAVEGSVAWWKKDSQHKYYQIATIIPEGRYWFRTQKPWHGHYVGLFAGGSWYDLENGARGYKGEFLVTGFSYGYMFPIGRSLSLEAGIGLGYLYTAYEEYLPIDGHYVYQQTSRTHWVGPVKLKFALVWRLWDQNKKGMR